MREAINRALRDEMAADPSVVVLGRRGRCEGERGSRARVMFENLVAKSAR